jgi:hypothetical protein
VLVDVGGDSCPKSLLGVTSEAGAAGGATGAVGFGRAIGAEADFVGAFFLGAAFFGAAFFAFETTFALVAFLAFFLATFFATPFLATARFAFAAGRFFPFFAFFLAMVSHLLDGHRAVHESSPEKVCCHLA